VLRSLRIENLVLIRHAELELVDGLNVVTGETGAGKTILAQAIGLLLGGRADASVIGVAGEEAYVEAELDLPPGLEDEEETGGVLDLRPPDEPGLVVARRIFPDGRSRSYAWGRAVARDDVAVVVERLIAMSGQFEQRRLARPSYQLDLLDAACGPEQAGRRAEARGAWRALAAARATLAELERDEGALRDRLAALEQLVADTEGMPAGEEDDLLVERDRIRNVSDVAAGVAAAAGALDPEDGEGAATLVASAERALAALGGLAPELSATADELRDVSLRLREAVADLARFRTSLEADPVRLEAIEDRLQLWADLRRRYRCATSEELLARREAAVEELEALAAGDDPIEAARTAVVEAQARVDAVVAALRAARSAAAAGFAASVTAELAQLGMADGEFAVSLETAAPGPTGADTVAFLVRANRGLELAPVATTASGGELSRIALALAAVAGGDTMVFDEIDAGIGGVTAHGVATTLRRLATHAQVVTVTHLPQIASVADAHFLVAKVDGDPTHTRIIRLDDEGHREELRRMMGGEEFVSSMAGSVRR
jgi:DNA repair protein RecN (Recombination protein N)